MTYPNRILYRSRKTALLLLLGCLVFICLGLWFITRPAGFWEGARRSDFFVRMVGWASILFFGLGGVLSVVKIINRRPAFIFNQDGFQDNQGMASFGLIRWSEVKEIELRTVFRNTFIIVHLHHPEAFLQREHRPLIKRLHQTNARHYGSPVTLTGSALEISQTEFLDLLHQGLEAEKARN